MNKAIAAAVLAALAEQAAAANVHRHLHRELEKRAVEVEWVTVWETVHVTAGQEPTPTKAKEHVMNLHAPKPATTSSSTSTTTSTSTSSTTTSTTSIVVPPTTTKAPPPAEPTTQPPPSPKPTTLATSIKPAAVEPSAEAKPESQPSSSDAGLLDISVSIPILNPGEPTSTTESTSKPTSNPDTPSNGGSPFSGKRGLAYNDGVLANLFGGSCEVCGWGYNWASTRQGLDEKYSFVPMLWGDKPEFTDNWADDAEDAISSGSKALFSFNEPDNAGQANMQPADAASAHAKYLNKYSGRALIGAPAITNSGSANEGIEWLKQFMNACDAQDGGCAIDFCNVHWYSEAQYADTLFEHLEKAHEACGGKPVWLTEFAPFGSNDQISDFLKTNIPKLDKLDYLDAYSYFMVGTDSLLSTLEALSDYGDIYATVS